MFIGTGLVTTRARRGATAQSVSNCLVFCTEPPDYVTRGLLPSNIREAPAHFPGQRRMRLTCIASVPSCVQNRNVCVPRCACVCLSVCADFRSLHGHVCLCCVAVCAHTFQNLNMRRKCAHRAHSPLCSSHYLRFANQQERRQQEAFRQTRMSSPPESIPSTPFVKQIRGEKTHRRRQLVWSSWCEHLRRPTSTTRTSTPATALDSMLLAAETAKAVWSRLGSHRA